jgi:hypothetical protein
MVIFLERRRPLLAAILTAILFSTSLADTFTVTTSSDSGTGSLRSAMLAAAAHAGADTIAFNIPLSDPGYAAVPGVWKIRPLSALPGITNGATRMDGSTQTANQGDKNPQGPEIEISGELIVPRVEGITITSSDNFIRGLVLHHYTFAIFLNGTSAKRNQIMSNYIGTDPTGMERRGNQFGGIYINGGAHGSRIGDGTPEGRNLIAGTDSSTNLYTGNGLTIRKADSAVVLGNLIGVNRLADAPISNIRHGIVLRETRYNTIGGPGNGEGNVIAANGGIGILIRSYADGNNVLAGNFIGTDPAGTRVLGNATEGILLDFGASDNVIGPANRIRYNGASGIRISHDSTDRNVITRNSIRGNGGPGIALDPGANDWTMSPYVTGYSASAVTGRALPQSTVEIFSDSGAEGGIYEGTVTADDSGRFSWNGHATGPRVTVTCTDARGNTSPFGSALVSVRDREPGTGIPGRFSLEQNYPNPFNPATAIRYVISERSRVMLRIFDLLGREVACLVNDMKEPGAYIAVLDGTPFTSGVYICALSAGGENAVRKMVLLK